MKLKIKKVLSLSFILLSASIYSSFASSCAAWENSLVRTYNSFIAPRHNPSGYPGMFPYNDYKHLQERVCKRAELTGKTVSEETAWNIICAYDSMWSSFRTRDDIYPWELRSVFEEFKTIFPELSEEIDTILSVKIHYQPWENDQLLLRLVKFLKVLEKQEEEDEKIAKMTLFDIINLFKKNDMKYYYVPDKDKDRLLRSLL